MRILRAHSELSILRDLNYIYFENSFQFANLLSLKQFHEKNEYSVANVFIFTIVSIISSLKIYRLPSDFNLKKKKKHLRIFKKTMLLLIFIKVLF